MKYESKFEQTRWWGELSQRQRLACRALEQSYPYDLTPVEIGNQIWGDGTKPKSWIQDTQAAVRSAAKKSKQFGGPLIERTTKMGPGTTAKYRMRMR
jgi:hypothetical protein